MQRLKGCAKVGLAIPLAARMKWVSLQIVG